MDRDLATRQGIFSTNSPPGQREEIPLPGHGKERYTVSMIQNGDFDYEKVFVGDITRERCAVCGKPAGPLGDMAWAEERYPPPGEVAEGFLHHRRCEYGDLFEPYPHGTSLDWDNYGWVEVIDAEELARRRSRLTLSDLRCVHWFAIAGDAAADTREVTILRNERGTVLAYALTAEDDIYVRRLVPDTTDEFERDLLARIDREQARTRA